MNAVVSLPPRPIVLVLPVFVLPMNPPITGTIPWFSVDSTYFLIRASHSCMIGFALENLSSVIIGQSLSCGSKHLAFTPSDFKVVAKILALVLSPIDSMSSESCFSKLFPDELCSISSSVSVVLPIADTTTATLCPFFAFFATDFAAFVILSLSARLEPPNLATIILLEFFLFGLDDFREEFLFDLIIFDGLVPLEWFVLELSGVFEDLVEEINALTENVVTYF